MDASRLGRVIEVRVKTCSLRDSSREQIYRVDVWPSSHSADERLCEVWGSVPSIVTSTRYPVEPKVR